MLESLTETPTEVLPAATATLRPRATANLRLSVADLQTLRQVLGGPCDFVPDALFDQPDAQKRVFDDAPPIPRPDSSWYRPVMEHMGDDPGARRTRAPVLSAAQERALFLQFNYCRFCVAKLREQVGDNPVRPDQARQLLSWHRKAQAYRDQIIQSNLGLVLAMVRRAVGNQVEFSELVSEGNMALLRTVAHFDAARGFKFSTYACRAILKAFSRARHKLHTYRRHFPVELDPEMDRSDFAEKKRNDDEVECVNELRQIVSRNKAALTGLEQEVIERRFALGLTPRAANQPATEPLTLEQVGRLIGVTRERVRQIQNRALAKIRMTLETDYLA